METNALKILITGSKGFIAKNLIAQLHNRGYHNLLLCNRDTVSEKLEEYIAECDILFHLAGVNRPSCETEYYAGNVGFTEQLIKMLECSHKKIHIVYSSTILQSRHEAYKKSKFEAEEILRKYALKSGSVLSIFRLPNVFGKWCKSNYNSFVATFCYNISHGLEIKVDNPDAQISLAYIDDVVDEFIACINGSGQRDSLYREIPYIYHTTVGEVAEMIKSFRAARESLAIPNVGNPLEKRLYSTYLSYMEPEDFCYSLKMNTDCRGSFTELLRSPGFGQFSINVAKPGVEKGNHWHHTKIEKFLVVKGTASIKLRHMITGKVTEFIVSDDRFEVIDIPAGYTHNICNIGSEDLVTVMWANELFDKDKPDTYYEEV